MKSTTQKRVLILILSIVLCVTFVTGCSKGTPDEYYWHSYYDTMEIPIETESSETTDTDNSSDINPNDNNSTDNTPTSPQQPTNTNVGLSNATVDKNDKPVVKNTANLMKPIAAISDTEANAMRNKILSTTDNIKVTGKTYYISYRGSDENDGLSPQNPWKTLTKLSYSNAQLRNGDAVLFERGGVYRGNIGCVNGVTYGAYGSGDKPCIYQSKENAAKKSWTNVGKNLWTAPSSYRDVGIIVFNHGEATGVRLFTKSKLSKNGDFYNDGSNVYLYMDKNPTEKYRSIEIGDDYHIFTVPENGHDILIDNICMKYGGAMGVQVSQGAKNIVVTNCEMGWLGGSVLSGSGESSVRYGNGVEFWNGCENVKVDNCWVYQIYDSGLSHQGNGKNFVQKNVIFSNNLVEYVSFAAIEWWVSNGNRMEDILYTGNILRFAGYGWGDDNRIANSGSSTLSARQAALILSSSNLDQYCSNFVISNNVFDTAYSQIVAIRSLAGTLPDLEGNKYYQSNGDKTLGRYGNLESAQTTTYKIDNPDILSILKQPFNCDAGTGGFGDTTAIVEYK